MTTTETIVTKLVKIVGATHVSSAPADMEAYGGLEPFVVVWPGAAPEVGQVLRACSELGVAVGVSGCGNRATKHWPVQDERLRVALDTRRMINILEVDELSLTVHSQCGIQLAHLDEALHRQGLTLGPFPVEILQRSLGGILAAPHPRAHSPFCGWLSDGCLALSVAHADGSVIHTRVAPRRATGPDITRLYIGSRGAFGVITTVVLRIFRRPEQEAVSVFALPDLLQALRAARDCLVTGLRPHRMQVLDELEARETLGEIGVDQHAALLIALGGAPSMVAQEQEVLGRIIIQASGAELPQSMAAKWWADGQPPVPPGIVGARLSHSEVSRVVESLPQKIKKRPLLLSVGGFDRQGMTLWLRSRGPKAEQNVLRALLLDAGVDPFRLDFPPLFEELRRQLDPDETLVIMEG
jgi:alkyldihydroxyacetonephosphate synthase